jgi:predicted transcriptional regulator
MEVDVLSPPGDIIEGESFTFFVKVKVPLLSEEENLRNQAILIQATDGVNFSNIADFKILIHPSVETSSWWNTTIVAAAGAVGIFAVVGSSEVGKYKFISFVGPLYTKLKSEEILDHYTRGKIHGYILANPGDHYNSIKKALEVSNGSFAYHLRVLEREGLIKSKRDGLYKRFYPYSAKIPQDNGKKLNDTQRIIIEKIRTQPGISQKDIALLLGVKPQTVNYHINKLIMAGFVLIERRGIGVKYFLNTKTKNTI